MTQVNRLVSADIYWVSELRVFLSSANFESNLSVRTLMWLAKNGAPKSSWIFLLLMYQAAPVEMQRHLDCSTCGFLTWLRAADLQDRALIVHHETDNGLYLSIRLASRTAELEKASGCVCEWRASRCSSRRWWRSFLLSVSAVSRWCKTPGSWQVALACGTWLWWPCRPHREVTRRGGKG